jgi:hypothetical protein
MWRGPRPPPARAQARPAHAGGATPGLLALATESAPAEAKWSGSSGRRSDVKVHSTTNVELRLAQFELTGHITSRVGQRRTTGGSSQQQPLA